MTSASSQINQSLLNLFVNSHRNMPACVATSFPHVSSDVYNQDYVRGDHGRECSSCSSESTGCEDCNDQFSSTTSYSRQVHKKSPESINSPRSGIKSERGSPKDLPNKFENQFAANTNINEWKRFQKTKLASNQIKSKKRKCSREGEDMLDEQATVPPRESNTPIKKRHLHSSDEDNRETEGNSPDMKPKPSVKVDGSSDILQQMYASFGKNFNGHLAKCHFSESLRGLDRDYDATSAYYKSIEESIRGSCDQQERCLPVTDPPGKHKDRRQLTEREVEGERCSGDESELKSKREKSSLNKRKHSVESQKSQSVSCGSHFGREDTFSSPKQSRRSRYSSSDSTDSQSRSIPNRAPDYSKQDNPWFSFLNPMLHSRGALGNFGIPNPGCNFPLPGISPPNPLMFNANPYLFNPALVRDMMASSRMPHLPPLFSNVNFSPFQAGVGISPQQLQAIQQLQSSFLYQTTSPLFPHGSYPASPGVFPMPPTMLSAGQTMGDFGQPNSGKSSLGPMTSRTSKRSSSSEPRKGLSGKSHDVTSDLSSSSSSQESKHQTDRNEKEEEKKKRKRTHSDKPRDHSHHHLNSKKEEKSRAPFSSKSQQTSNVLKKKGDRKGKYSVKNKETNRNEKIPQSVIRSDRSESPSKDIIEESIECDSTPPGATESEKSPSYKNLTRERRLVANARERTRVHTISSAFDELRGQIPSYSCNQKLSKLAILRIACEYIRTLSVLAGHDETLTLGQGVDRCTRVLQSESRARSRRKNNKAQIEWEVANYDRHKSQEEEMFEDIAPGSSSGEDTNRCLSASDDPPPQDSTSEAVENSTDVKSPNDFIENNDELVDVESIDDDKLSDASG